MKGQDEDAELYCQEAGVAGLLLSSLCCYVMVISQFYCIPDFFSFQIKYDNRKHIC